MSCSKSLAAVSVIIILWPTHSAHRRPNNLRNDPRLLRKSPKAVAISGWLERPFGNNVACFGTAIAPTVGGFLALADFTEVSARVVMSGGG